MEEYLDSINSRDFLHDEDIGSRYTQALLHWKGDNHGLLNYVDTKAKCCHLKKLICTGTLRQVVICLSNTPSSPSQGGGEGERDEPEKRGVVICLSNTPSSPSQGGGGGGERWTREKRRGATDHKARSKIPTWLTESPLLQSINSAKHLLQSPFTGNLFRWLHFALPSKSLIFLRGKFSIDRRVQTGFEFIFSDTGVYSCAIFKVWGQKMSSFTKWLVFLLIMRGKTFDPRSVMFPQRL
jgi:hypothetical protein